MLRYELYDPLISLRTQLYVELKQDRGTLGGRILIGYCNKAARWMGLEAEINCNWISSGAAVMAAVRTQ